MTFRDLSPTQIEAIRQQFVTGGKPAKIGKPFGLSGKQVSDYACKRRWKVEKAKVCEVLAEKSTAAVAANVVARASDYITQHTDDWQKLRAPVMALIDADLSKLTEEQVDELKAKAHLAMGATKLFTAIQTGQRKSLGIDDGKTDGPTLADAHKQLADREANYKGEWDD